LKKLIADARNNKVDAMVLDLSNNGGGSLEDAVKIAEVVPDALNTIRVLDVSLQIEHFDDVITAVLRRN
jgi:C-terminal processing protease CtpA/Prc